MQPRTDMASKLTRYDPLREITRLTFRILPGGGLIEAHFHPLPTQRKKLLQAALVEDLWLPVLKLCAALGEWDRALLIPEEWKEYEDSTFVSIVRKPQEGKRSSRQFTAVLHLNGLLPNDWSFEKGLLELFIVPGLHWAFFDELQSTAPDRALHQFLTEHLPALQTALEEVARVLLRDPGLALWTAVPVWENEGGLAWKANGYRIKAGVV